MYSLSCHSKQWSLFLCKLYSEYVFSLSGLLYSSSLVSGLYSDNSAFHFWLSFYFGERCFHSQLGSFVWLWISVWSCQHLQPKASQHALLPAGSLETAHLFLCWERYCEDRRTEPFSASVQHHIPPPRPVLLQSRSIHVSLTLQSVVSMIIIRWYLQYYRSNSFSSFHHFLNSIIFK